MAGISRKQLLLMLMYVVAEDLPSEGVRGITRLQKLLFLLEKEARLQSVGDVYEFRPYKAGPFSSALYDDLEFLENLGLIESEVTGESTEEEAVELEQVTFQDLMGDCGDDSDGCPDDESWGADAYEERRYVLTPEGRKKVERLMQTGKYAPVVDGIRKIKSKYGHYSLSDLLYYVYTQYPKMATESEIKEKVLRRRRQA